MFNHKAWEVAITRTAFHEVRVADASNSRAKCADLFRNSRQAFLEHAPHAENHSAFDMCGEDAIIRKEGQRLIIEPAPPKSLLTILATLATLDEEFPPIEDGPAEPVDL